MTAASPNLRAELNGAEEDGPEHDARIFGEVTDLFLSNVDRLGDSQIAAVDGVLAHLIERVEAATVIQLSEALSTIDRAPLQTIYKLAFHGQPQVAAPVLRNSNCLSDADLLEIVKSRGQQHLLAICDRKMLNEALTDALMRFGDVNVSNALARNTGARFSECGYATLVGRAERDEGLAERLGVRLDIPGSLLRELIGKVAEAGGANAKVLKQAFEAVEQDEDHHLYHTMGWCRELWIQSLGMPAVLPPPEEIRDVETAIGASRAEQARDQML